MDTDKPRKMLDDDFRGRLQSESDEVNEHGILYRRARGNTASFVACDQQGNALAMDDDNGYQVWPISF